MKYSGIGGQAVIEGVMMKNKTEYAVAVRKPDHELVIKKEEYIGLTERHRLLGIPILRGVVNFVESMKLGMKTLTYSASFFEEEEDAKPTKMEDAMKNVFKDKAESVLVGITICVAILLAVGLFMLLPFFLSELFRDKVNSPSLRGLIEGAIRIVIFITYIKAISMMKDIKRVFMYHGAEHKTINCVENGLELSVANVKNQSKEHKRCGTSFLLIVMFISILFFVFIQVNNIWMRMAFRILLVPLIAGISYEFIRFIGNHDSVFIKVISRPGMWLQALTTKEPDEEMIEVAIASVEAVFDWKKFLKRSNREEQTSTEQVATALVEEEKPAFMYLSVEEDIEEEEDEILKALDRYFDAPSDENQDT